MKKFFRSSYFWIGISLIEFGVLLGFYTGGGKGKFLHTFIDKNGDFQWICITSIMGILTFVFTLYNNAQSNNVKIVTANRIKRNDINRDNIANYIAAVTEFASLIRRSSYRLTNKEQMHDYLIGEEFVKEKERWGEIYEDIRRIKETLLLSFSPKEKGIIRLIEAVHDDCKDILSSQSHIVKTHAEQQEGEEINLDLLHSYYDDVSKYINECNVDRKKLRTTCSQYFEDEWNSAVDEYKIK